MPTIKLRLDEETLAALDARATAEHRPMDLQAEVQLRRALGLEFPDLGEFLRSYAKEHGEKVVEVACKNYLKRPKWEGAKPTKAKAFKPALVKKLWTRQYGICARMNHPVSLKEATVDHFEPRNGGGGHEERNLRMVCKSCNSSKGDNTPQEESRKTGATILEQLPKGE